MHIFYDIYYIIHSWHGCVVGGGGVCKKNHYNSISKDIIIIIIMSWR